MAEKSNIIIVKRPVENAECLVQSLFKLQNSFLTLYLVRGIFMADADFSQVIICAWCNLSSMLEKMLILQFNLITLKIIFWK